MEYNWKCTELMLRNFPVTSLQLVRREKDLYKIYSRKQKPKILQSEKERNISIRRAANTHTKTKEMRNR